MGELKQALGDLGFGQRAQAAAEDMVQEAAGKNVGSIVLADFLQFLRRVCCLTAITSYLAHCISHLCLRGVLWSDGQGLYS